MEEAGRTQLLSTVTTEVFKTSKGNKHQLRHRCLRYSLIYCAITQTNYLSARAVHHAYLCMGKRPVEIMYEIDAPTVFQHPIFMKNPLIPFALFPLTLSTVSSTAFPDILKAMARNPLT